MRILRGTWGSLLLMALLSAVAVGALQYTTGMETSQAATSVASFITALAVALALRTFKATHEWNRRHYTVEMLSQWNEKGRFHVEFLQRQFPEYFPVPDFVKNPEALREWRLDPARAKEIAISIVANTKGSPSRVVLDLEIRSRLIQLLNYFEQICVAYDLRVLDKKAFEDSFAPIMIELYLYFEPFVDELRRLNRREPWQPLARTITLWIEELRFRKAQQQRDVAKARLDEALGRVLRHLRELTDH